MDGFNSILAIFAFSVEVGCLRLLAKAKNVDLLCRSKENGYGIAHYSALSEEDVELEQSFSLFAVPTETRRKIMTSKSLGGVLPIHLCSDFTFGPMATIMKKEGLTSELLSKNPLTGDSLMHLICHNGWMESEFGECNHQNCVDGLLDAICEESKEDKTSLLTSPNLEGVTPLVKFPSLLQGPLPICFTPLP